MPRRSLLLLTFFFFSGAAALAYEVVWIRLLSLTLSVTVYALTTVLCAFMSGLAIGSAISARIADRIARPFTGFGAIEIGIALCGVTAPFLLTDMLPPVYLWLHEAFAGQGVVFAGGRFLLAFLVMLLPTTLMGLTLPLLSRAVIDKHGGVGLGAGSLYAANTLGAVLGCVLAGFVLIPELGLRGTSNAAAAVNVAIGIAALVLGRSHRVEIRAPGPTAEAPPSPLVVIAAVAYAISGFTAMGYEILWTRALEHYTHNSTYAYTAMLATFLVGLGGGSALMARRSDRFEKPTFALGVLQVGIAISVVAALTIYHNFEAWIPALAEGGGGLTSFGRAVALIFSEAAATMLVTTLLLGAMFPIVSRLAVESLTSVGRRIGIVYLLNTLGSIAGSLLVGFFVLPQLGLRGAFLTLVAINLGLGAFLALRTARTTPSFLVAGTAALTLGAAFVLLPPQFFEGQFRERFHLLRFFREEITDTVMVTEAPNGSRMIRYSDGRGTAGTSTVDGDRMYGQLPLLLHPQPKRVLQIAFGVGNSLSSVLQHPVEHVDCVELSPGVIEAAPYFASTNRNSIDDPRVTLFVQDGRNFLLTSKDEYDVIRLDPPELHTRGVVNLYTREFYESARDHLAPGGIFSIWVNIVMTPEDDMRTLTRTVLDVFPHVTVWHDPGKFSWILNGSMEPRPPDLALLEEKFANDAIRADLESIRVDTPYKVLAHFVFSETGAAEFAGPGPLVVDDRTILDFSVPRSRDSAFGIANYNTNNWLVQLTEPDAPDRLVLKKFFEKATLMGRHKQPVLEQLANRGAHSDADLQKWIEAAGGAPSSAASAP